MRFGRSGARRCLLRQRSFPWRWASARIRSCSAFVSALVLRPLPVRDPGTVMFVQRVGSFVSHSWITDFRVYEKNSNPNPGMPHE